MPKDEPPDPRLGRRIIAEARLVRYERRIERAIGKALDNHKRRAMDALATQHMTAAAPPNPFDSDVWDSTVDDEVVPVINEVLKDVAAWTTGFLALPPEVRAAALGRIDVAGRVDDFTRVVRTVGPTVSGRLIDELHTGVGKGESIDKLTRRITTTFAMGYRNAERIAVTETHGAAEATSWDSAQALADAGFDLDKEWVSHLDRRTRPSHRRADGQKKQLNDAFIVGGAQMSRPGHGPASEVIRCRCTAIYSIRDEAEADKGLVAKRSNTAGGYSSAMKMLEARHPGIDSWVSEKDGSMTLSKVVVDKKDRSSGKGTKFMNDLTDYADAKGKRIDLTPSADFGGSKGRLVEFYKRFGFVENKGRRKDYSISESMYRLPTNSIPGE